MINILNFFNNISNDIFIIYSSYITQYLNIISIGAMLLINTYTLLHFYYNVTHGLDPYARSEIYYLLIFNFIAIISTGVTLYNSNPQIFGNKQNQNPTPNSNSILTPTPSPTPSSTPISTPSITHSSTI